MYGKKPSEYRSQVPFFWLFPFPALMAVVYLYGGFAKLNADWLQAEPLRSWLKPKSDMPIIGGLISHEWTAWFMSYGGLFFDLTIVFFLLSKRFRKGAFWIVIFFHGLNHLVFNIGIFPFLSVVLTLMFFPPESHTQFWKKLSNRFSFTRKWWQSWTERIHSEPEISTTIPSVATKKFLNICLALILIFHLTIPFRHHLYPGDVAWTEEGHKYAWRMKLRSKHGYGYFEIEEKNHR
jgi:vitamin K-dependent gamma-carboxylase